MPRKMQARSQIFPVQRNGFFLFFNELERVLRKGRSPQNRFGKRRPTAVRLVFVACEPISRADRRAWHSCLFTTPSSSLMFAAWNTVEDGIVLRRSLPHNEKQEAS
jgi:hypothetical protein